MFIKKTSILPFLEYLAWKYDNNVYVPTGSCFELFSGKHDKKDVNVTKVDLDCKTLFSAKKLFLPAKETLFKFSDRSSPHTPQPQSGYTVLFGARPCDLNAIKYMDKIFNEDPYYMARRSKMVIIGIQCTKPRQFKNCYCHYTGTLFADRYDLLLIPARRIHDSGYLVKAGTIRGEGLVATKHFIYKPMGDTFEKAMARIARACEKATGPKAKQGSKGCLRAEGPINDDVVKELTKDCYSCTACTSVCPTCHSFLIEDELDIDRQSGARVRQWDSCQLQRYTRVAGNNVFRPSREQRMRQRIMCKFRYSLEDQGMMSCTGCGRCVDVCNKGIDMFKVFRKPKGRVGAKAKPRKKSIPRKRNRARSGKKNPKRGKGRR
jgi:ferredoxin